MMKRILGMLAFGIVPGLSAKEFSPEDISFFSEKVRPLLEDHCVRCHGGKDSKGHVKAKSGLQLISRKGIVIGGDHGSAFDEKEPEKSLLLHVVSYEDDNLQMPPKGKLNEEARAVLLDWVKRGMPWTPEDADVLLEVEEDDKSITTINEFSKSRWSYQPMSRPEVPVVDNAEWKAPIDAFIYDGVSKKGLQPNAPASRAELIRRAYYNLTGLSPTLAEVREFENDKSPNSWEKVIDRLLASTAYGEKWGRHWLDLVRYAETNGFERDSDKPFVWRYRDYVIKALNEDKPYNQFLIEQLAGDELAKPTFDSMAATGYHHLMQWDDEPADRKQHYYDVLDDNVRTTTEVMLGMTVGCARCHDHKGDPISQEDYYHLMSFFRGIVPFSRGEGPVEKIVFDGVDDGYEAVLAAHRQHGENLKKELAKIEKRLLVSLGKGESDSQGPVRWLVSDARTKKPQEWHYSTTPADGWSEVGFRAENHQWKTGKSGFGTQGPGMIVNTQWASPELWLQTSFLLEEIPKSLKLSLHHDENVQIFVNGQPVIQRDGFRADYDEVMADQKFLEALQVGRNVIAAHISQTQGGQYFDFGISVVEKSRSLESLLTSKGGEEAEKNLVNRWKRLKEDVRKNETELPKRGVEILTAKETGKDLPPTYLHIRGSANAEDLDKEMTPRIPGIFGGEELAVEHPANGRNSSGRRTALAKWIARDDNPRTSRVMMNRVWQHHFGRGICRSSNDFGFLGEDPTQPELLDWLASEFVAQGWSLKKMHKMIMMSRAFQMSSKGTPDALAKDPDNDSFWRFDMRRLTAEEVRDSILAVSGTLNRKMGGPGVFIPLPEEVLATSSKKGGAWGKSSPEDEVRRTVYVKVKRSMVPPQLADLDVADTDTTCPVRFATTVPTQALGFLNSKFMNDQAKIFADRLRREAGEDRKDRVRLGLELALARPAKERELEYSHEFFDAMREKHGLSEEEALERFALLVLNLNEFIFLD
ncbi:PSD1 and planctomycete cytochrome C domain-containing protein [Akkermansiaceae bacterium]|nr:PSD1 and planctomycete cytochrome C domain-containing protein [Akkermansiaceae bacterium]